MVYISSKLHLTPEDITFIAEQLGSTQNEQIAITHLLVPDELTETSLDDILKDKRLWMGIVKSEKIEHVSSSLFFYLAIQHYLDEVGITDIDIVDYVSGVLHGFVEHKKMTKVGTYHFEHVVDLRYAAKAATEEHLKFSLSRHLGNYTLYVSGMFPEHLERSRSILGVKDFEDMGREGFARAVESDYAGSTGQHPVLSWLVDHFHVVRGKLNHFSMELQSAQKKYKPHYLPE